MEKEPQNVYEAMQAYYDEYDEITYFPREVTENFIRQKAWQGESDEQLQRMWEQIQLFELYILHKQLEALTFFSAEDYLYSAYWLTSEEADFSLAPNKVAFYLDVLVDFIRYLRERDKQLQMAPILQAKQMFEEDANVIRFEKDRIDTFFPGESPGAGAEEEDPFAWELLELVEDAIAFFSDNPAFRHDYVRSMSWFHGLLETDENEQNEILPELWQDYWYYFLFEYHLLQDDQRPIAYYLENVNRANNDPVDLDILLRSRLVLFYVERQPVGDAVNCRDLLTDESFVLPEPDESLPWFLLRQQLFIGQRYCCSGNYGGRYSSVQVSGKLRNRIKAELQRLLAVFHLQEPTATWRDLLDRHSLFVRYMLETFVRFNQLTVFPAELPGRAVINQLCEIRAHEPADKVEQALAKLVGSAADCFSQFDWRLMALMWRDYCCLKGKPQDEADMTWAAAILSLFNDNNGIWNSVLLQARIAGMEKQDVKAKRQAIIETLELAMPDFRYMNEYGYVRFLLT